jgi:hypothetical protein
MFHLEQLQKKLKTKTNFQIFKEVFSVRQQFIRYPILTSIINGVEKTCVYRKDFHTILDAPEADFLTPIRLTVIPNFGCDEEDWQNATPS